MKIKKIQTITISFLLTAISTIAEAKQSINANPWGYTGLINMPTGDVGNGDLYISTNYFLRTPGFSINTHLSIFDRFELGLVGGTSSLGLNPIAGNLKYQIIKPTSKEPTSLAMGLNLLGLASTSKLANGNSLYMVMSHDFNLPLKNNASYNLFSGHVGFSGNLDGARLMVGLDIPFTDYVNLEAEYLGKIATSSEMINFGIKTKPIPTLQGFSLSFLTMGTNLTNGFKDTEYVLNASYNLKIPFLEAKDKIVDNTKEDKNKIQKDTKKEEKQKVKSSIDTIQIDPKDLNNQKKSEKEDSTKIAKVETKIKKDPEIKEPPLAKSQNIPENFKTENTINTTEATKVKKDPEIKITPTTKPENIAENIKTDNTINAKEAIKVKKDPEIKEIVKTKKDIDLKEATKTEPLKMTKEVKNLNILKGQIKVALGKNLPKNILVSLKSNKSNFELKTETDVEGNFKFTEIPKGEYLLTIKKDGFLSSQRQLIIKELETEIFSELLSAKGVISGMVFDSKNKPLADLNISVNKVTSKTDLNGKFTLLDVDTGYQQLIISKNNKELKSIEIDVISGTELTKEISLDSEYKGELKTQSLTNTSSNVVKNTFSATLLGKVDSKSGLIKGARIIIEGEKLTVLTVSDKDGLYSIKNIPLGTYKMTVSKQGYDSKVFSIEIKETKEFKHDIKLK